MLTNWALCHSDIGQGQAGGLIIFSPTTLVQREDYYQHLGVDNDEVYELGGDDHILIALNHVLCKNDWTFLNERMN